MLRTFAATLAVACLTLAGCSGASVPSEVAPGGASITHRYGTTEVPVDPQRVVTVGLTDHDTVLALGVTPVAVTDWFGDQPYGVWPWAQDALGDATPVVLEAAAAQMEFEKIAAAAPDLILAVNSGLTQAQYDTLTAIAPTVAQSGEFVDYGTPWQDQTRIIGAALGRTAQAEELVADVEADFAAAREANPRFDGAIGIIGLTGTDGDYYPYGPEDARARFLGALGFAQAPGIAELAGENFFATISAERFDLLADADVLVWIAATEAERTALQTNPAYAALTLVQEGRDVFPAYDPLGAALSYNSVLSLPFAIDGMVPLLQAAIDGDPATTA
ncbi:MAG: iron-siderophore ABC transporter substrate-binding protein [Pseudonocardia sp.]|nr:iron-siderophore ABC transporter substrate-binding protein [Pseudonocardia sp.]